MNKHEGFTPGPWQIWNAPDSVALLIDDGTPEGKAVAYLTHAKTADVQLIAAAPDLLAENERMRALLAEIESFIPERCASPTFDLPSEMAHAIRAILDRCEHGNAGQVACIKCHDAAILEGK